MALDKAVATNSVWRHAARRGLAGTRWTFLEFRYWRPLTFGNVRRSEVWFGSKCRATPLATSQEAQSVDHSGADIGATRVARAGQNAGR